MKIRYFIFIFLLFCTSVVLGQGAKFTVSVSKNPVGAGDIFTVTFAVNGNADNFTPPHFNGFEIAGGPNVSTSLESVNGSTLYSTAYSYDLMAVKEGDYSIGTASITVNGHPYRTQPITVKVVRGSSVAQQNRQQNGQQAPVKQGPAADMSKLVFMKAVVDKTNVYEGQQISVTYRLYTRVGIESMQPDVVPALNGFWNEEIKLKELVRDEVYKGVHYKAVDIKQDILFPEHSGDITVDPFGMTVVAQVQTASSDPFDSFFGSFKNVKYEAKSAPVVIHVKPLPDVGKPKSFTGAVGNFNVETSIDKTELKANDALNYRVKVTGSGNIKLLKNLAVNFPPDFEKYDPKITDSVIENGNGVSGYRIYNYLLIPRHQGSFNIDPLKFSYFNASTGRYYSLGAKGFTVKVDKGTAESNVTAVADADKQDVKMLSKDIRYIKTGDAGLIKDGDLFFGSIGYYLLLLIGPVLVYAAYLYRNWLIKNNSDLVKVKSRQAGKVAAKHLANAQKQLLAGNTGAFYEDLFNGLYGYLSDKLNIQYADLNKETIGAALQERKVSDKLTGQLLDTLDLCEMARYAPVTHISQQEVFEKAKGIINDIENEI